jgi:hypothetical protein
MWPAMIAYGVIDYVGDQMVYSAISPILPGTLGRYTLSGVMFGTKLAVPQNLSFGNPLA